MKVCTKCNVEKDFIDFSKQKKGKHGYRSTCIECDREYRKQYHLNNKEALNKKSKTYRINNQNKLAEYNKKYRLENIKYYKDYRLNNKENSKKYSQENSLKNKDRINIYGKKYRLENKDMLNKKYYHRKKTDPLFKLTCNIRNLIANSIKKRGFTKKSKTYQILGCTFEEFKQHLEKQFIEGMNWDNRSLWHLDHIYPISLATDEEHLIRLNHYTNFQPMWAIDNIKKGNKI